MRRQTHILHQYFQLKSGHAVTGTILKSIGKTESNRFWECDSTSRIDVNHIKFR